MSENFIRVFGAKEHNLANIDVEIPRDKLVVITGLSGSGKSSLAFDTIYAEGQRKYVESLSAYARQFLEQMQKPDLEHIEGLPPTIAIEQRSASSNPRSTVATTTEVYDYLRLLFARVGTPHCHKCGREIQSQPVSKIVDSVMAWPEGQKIMILAPLIRGQKGVHKDVFARIQKEGFVRVRVDGEIYDIREAPSLEKAKYKKHTIEAVIDRLVVKPEIRTRLADSIELGLKQANGLVIITRQGDGEAWQDELFSEKYACPDCGVSLAELEPRIFSFNSPHGACRQCDGLGTILEFDPDLIVPDQELNLAEGAVDAWRHWGKRLNIYYAQLIREFCRDFKVSPNTPFKDLPARVRKVLLAGTTEADQKTFGAWFEGVIPNLNYRWEKTDSDFVKEHLHRYLSEHACRTCEGGRLRPEALAVRIASRNIQQITGMSIAEAYKFFTELDLTGEKHLISEQILKEIRHRLTFMMDVGLDYLTLDRTSGTLSGGEAQRIRLATQVGSGLVGVCYVLDEPTIGLHQRDNTRLIVTLKRLRDLGNTVIVVEHDEQTMAEADHIIDIGPGPGAHGGRIVAQGTYSDILNCPASLTGKYLSGRLSIETPVQRRELDLSNAIEVKGAAENNLKKIDVKFPLGGLVCVTGVSGSGKSTLVTQTLLHALKRRLYKSRNKPGKHTGITGINLIDKVIEIDQSPIGRTPRSNPATYVGVLDLIRQLFAQTREARIRAYKPGRFSFNVKGGRCEACQGQGTKKIEMHFMPDVYITCEECEGARYNRETLEIRYRGKNIADVLDMRVEEALVFFENFSKIKQLLQALNDVGLSYMALGQSSTTLSGGEAQRVKLASELGKTATGKTLYILDEPTTGLHFADIHNLLNVLTQLVDMGNTVVVIEHNLDVIKCADHIIDLGPEGGQAGGTVVATGTPEQVAANPNSHTGRFLAEKLPAAQQRAAS
ncbi:MAG: excinuclease ABC subunit UvrA [Phycisphaerae bacterium]|nr:excinuclease ABC subunit UvrA [Phycisphaerae bacterium]